MGITLGVYEAARWMAMLDCGAGELRSAYTVGVYCSSCRFVSFPSRVKWAIHRLEGVRPGLPVGSKPKHLGGPATEL